LAFLLPMIERALRPAVSTEGTPLSKTPRFLILAPTRELALQIDMELRKYAPPSVTSLAVYGGTPIERHYRALRRPPLVVVGTPGRLLDLAGSGHLHLGAVTWLVMDEADQMLDRGFLRDIQRILGLLPPERQTLLFSATFSAEIQQLAGTMQRNPAKISVDPGISSPTTITHAYYVVPAEHSRTQLVHTLLQAVKAGERSMIFCDQKYKVRRLASKLGGESASVGAITGNHSQVQRERTLGAFRAGRLTSLVATDVASRGLHIPDVSHVFNFDLPQDPPDYVHRIGRTARAGAEGDAISFACEEYAVSLPDIESYVGHKIPFAPIAPELLATGVVAGAAVHSHRPHRPGDRRPGGGRPGDRRPGGSHGGGSRGGGPRGHKGSPPGRSSHRGRGR